MLMPSTHRWSPIAQAVKFPEFSMKTNSQSTFIIGWVGGKKNLVQKKLVKASAIAKREATQEILSWIIQLPGSPSEIGLTAPLFSKVDRCFVLSRTVTSLLRLSRTSAGQRPTYSWVLWLAFPVFLSGLIPLTAFQLYFVVRWVEPVQNISLWLKH
jgi:hypothetical protein